jgi:hypothetical protein
MLCRIPRFLLIHLRPLPVRKHTAMFHDLFHVATVERLTFQQ